MAELIYQKEIVDASRLRQLASRDVCLRLIKKLVADGKIVRYHDKHKHNAIYFNAKGAKIVRDAFEAEAARRLASAQPETDTKDTTEPAKPEAAPKAEPKSVKQLAAAPGPEKRTPAKKDAKATSSSTKQEKPVLGMSKSVWLYVGAGALLLLAFGWWRAHRTPTVPDYAPLSPDLEPDADQGHQRQTLSDKEQLAKWDTVFEGI